MEAGPGKELQVSPPIVVGIGLNATDTVVRVRQFPALGGKEQIASSSMQAGGQIATALVTCQRLGLHCRYVGTLGDDEGGRFQLVSLKNEGLDLRYVRVARGAPNQMAFIVVDEATGERTVFWDRPKAGFEGIRTEAGGASRRPRVAD